MDSFEVFKVLARVSVEGGTRMAYGDMVFIDGTPHVVWNWLSHDGGNEWPGRTTALDSRFLQRNGPEFVYSQDLREPE
jgi:hypothetical protein